MDLLLDPETYSPSIDEMGNYTDKIPSFNIMKNGIRCLCGSRKDKTYENHTMFSNHIKTKTHLKWIENLNRNKANYYVENEQLKTTIQNQRIIIANYDKDIQNKNLTIDYLTKQLLLHSSGKEVLNLLDFDD